MITITSEDGRLVFDYGSRSLYIDKSNVQSIGFDYDGDGGDITHVSFNLALSGSQPKPVMRFAVADIESPEVLSELAFIAALDLTPMSSSGGEYNSGGILLVDGDVAPLQVDSTGHLLISIKPSELSALEKVGVTMHPTHFSPQHFSVAWTSTSIITCTPYYGLPAIDGNTMNVLSVKIDRADNTTITYINGKDGVKFTASANTITIYKNGILQEPFLNTDSKYRVAVNYIEIGEDPSTDTNKVTVENFPLMPSTAPLVDLSNQTTLTDYYYPSADGLDMSAYSGISIQGIITNVTASVEVTNDETPANWVDITKAGYELVTNSSGNTSIVATTSTSFMLDFDRLNCRLVRVKYRTTNGTNVMKCYINRK